MTTGVDDPTVDLVAAAQALQLDPARIRQWIRRGHLTSRGKDARGRHLIGWKEVSDLAPPLTTR